MEAGRELDALVAEKVMGLVPCQADCHRLDPEHPNLMPISGPCHAQPDSPNQGGETHQYSTDISAALEVADKLFRNNFWWQLTAPHRIGDNGNNYRVYFGRATPICSQGEAYAPTPALAICLAALKAVQP